MKTASVVELKTHLGRYLGLVGQGETVIVTSHRHPVACLLGLRQGTDDLQMIQPDRPVTDLDELAPVRFSRPVDGLRELLNDRHRR